MRFVLLIAFAMSISGCLWDTKYIVQCPAPPVIAPVAYATDTLGKEAPPSIIIKSITLDLLSCQDVEEQLRLALKGYEKIEQKE